MRNALIIFLNLLSLIITAQYDSIFNSYFNNPNAPGAVAAVGNADSVFFQKAYGLANLDSSEKITQNTLFEIASNSKQFTCFGLMLLEQEGKIYWEDDIRKYIPEMPFYGDTIRLKHCAHHTSGIKDYVALMHLAGWRQDSIVTFGETLNLIFNLSEPNFKPGEKYEYSNSGYALLAEIINRVTDEGFVAFMENKVFKAAKLESATIRTELKPIKNEATPYYFPSTAVKESRNLSQAYGASAILMNINDAIKWMQFVINPPEEYKALIQKMTSREEFNDKKHFHYKYGFYLKTYRDLDVVAHAGQWYGFTSVFRYFPKDSLFTIVMNNGNYEDRMWEWTEVVSDFYLGLESRNSGWNKSDKHKTVERTPDEMKKFEGEFIIKRAGHVKIFIKNNQLFGIDPFGDEYPLYHLGNNVFKWDSEEITAKFKKGALKYYFVKVGPLKIKARPYDDSKIKGLNHLDLKGSYYNKDLNVTYQVKIEDCKLVLHHKSHGTIPIKQRKKSTFNVGKWWMYEIHFIKEKGKITGFKMTGIARNYGELTFNKL